MLAVPSYCSPLESHKHLVQVLDQTLEWFAASGLSWPEAADMEDPPVGNSNRESDSPQPTLDHDVLQIRLVGRAVARANCREIVLDNTI